MFTQVEIEMERDEIRAKYGNKWQAMLPNSSRLFETEAEVVAFVESQGFTPVRNTRKSDGNYCRIDC